ncbi:MAG: WhiB family transcriptional regulator [Ornithinimicrobium sp.]
MSTTTRSRAQVDGSRSSLECSAPQALPCRVNAPDLWFAETTEQVEVAKALCAPCPLREACLRGALDRAEPWGVWGGEFVLEGVVIKRKRGRGRPRKDQQAA